jgi:HlyD family secretion protein
VDLECPPFRAGVVSVPAILATPFSLIECVAQPSQIMLQKQTTMEHQMSTHPITDPVNHSEPRMSSSTHFREDIGWPMRRWVGFMLFLGLLATGGYGLYQRAIIRQQSARKVLTAPVERQSLPITISANGTVKAERSINVSPKTSGRLKSLLVKEGDRVTQGQVLAYMDDSNLQGQKIEAQGQLAQAQANLRKLEAGNRPQDVAQAQAKLKEVQANLRKLEAGNRPQDVAQAQARLDSAQASLRKAEDDLQRHQELHNAGAIALQTLTQKRSDRDSAQAQVTEAQAALALQKIGTRSEEIDQARAQVEQQQQALDLLKAGTRSEEIDEAQAKVESARGSLRTIQAQIEDAVIRAPFAGTVTQKYADPGAFVTPTTAGSTVSGAASNSIVALASANQVVANVAEANIAQVRLGQSVTITADAYPGKTFRGQVTQIAAQATVSQNVTSFEVKMAILADSQNLLRVGMNVDTEFQAGQLKNAVVVPNVAVVRERKVTGVFVADPNGKPRFTPIQTGVTVNSKTEVKSGLKGIEHVLISFPPGTRPQSQIRTPFSSGGGSSNGGASNQNSSSSDPPPI